MTKKRSKQSKQGAGQPQQKERWQRDALNLLLKLFFLGLTLLLSFTFLFGLEVAPDDSMAQSIKAGDITFYYRLIKPADLTKDTVVVVEENHQLQLRRIVAGPGDEVSIQAEGLYVNGNLQTATYVTNETLPYADGPSYPLSLQDKQYFVLGDYRTNVSDSRSYGVVSLSQIKGVVITMIRSRRF